jgi:hypothetical protein
MGGSDLWAMVENQGGMKLGQRRQFRTEAVQSMRRVLNGT